MKQHTTIYEKGLVAAGLVAAAGLLFAFYTLVTGTQSSKPKALAAPAPAVALTEATPVDSARAAAATGKWLHVTASFDATQAAQLTWKWGDAGCTPGYPERKQVLSSLTGNESLTQTWSQCLSAESSQVVVLDRTWYPVSGSGTGVVEGKLLVVDSPALERKAESVFYALAGGLCESEEGPCHAALQVGTTPAAFTVSLSLADGQGNRRFFTPRNTSKRPARPVLTEEYEELTEVRSSTSSSEQPEIDEPEAVAP